MAKFGRMRRRISVERSTPTLDRFGQSQPAWAEVYPCWADVRDLSGMELQIARQIRPEVTHAITIRYPPSLALTPKDRINYGGRILNISAITNPDQRNRTLEILATEVIQPNA